MGAGDGARVGFLVGAGVGDEVVGFLVGAEVVGAEVVGAEVGFLVGAAVGDEVVANDTNKDNANQNKVVGMVTCSKTYFIVKNYNI